MNRYIYIYIYISPSIYIYILDPPFAEGEDEASIELHKEFLKAKWKKRARDEEKISQRMEMTFPDRRRIVNDGKPIKQIKEAYPTLFCQSQVIIHTYKYTFINIYISLMLNDNIIQYTL